MKVNGSCHCGYIKFKAEVSNESIVCHCTDCQVLSGSAFRINVPAPEPMFEIQQGELKSHVKVANSGDTRVQTFCPHCATPIYSAVAENPKTLFIRIGAIEKRASIQPAIQLWQRSTLCSYADLSKVKGSAEQQALTSK